MLKIVHLGFGSFVSWVKIVGKQICFYMEHWRGEGLGLVRKDNGLGNWI